MKKLNLQWVSDSIGNDYKKWNKGDTVLLQAQTGTGKTYFIKNVLLDDINSTDKLLLVCNRTNLKRQLKKDLLEKYNLEFPETLNELDEITTIGNVTITSYHAISKTIKNYSYDSNESKCDISHYEYIVFDECHFIFSDGGFNNEIRYAYDEIVCQQYPFSIKIFISATMNEIKPEIIKCVNHANENGFGLDDRKIHEYRTGDDYSYINAKYFKKLDNIINLIKNDATDEKWLIFISDIERDGKKIIEALGDEKSSLIRSGTESDELNSIINDSKFNKKVLVCTKALDNGININDPLLKNIVIMTWDRITFIQMLGRKRIDIDNAETVNLFIPTRYKKSFMSKLHGYYEKKMAVKLLNEDKLEFYLTYDNKLSKFNGMDDIFYRDYPSGEIKYNKIGCKRLMEDIRFAESMVAMFEFMEDEYTFIREQLRWLGLKDSDCEGNMIEDVVVYEEINKLEKYLDTLVGNRLFKDEQNKLIETIKLKDARGRIQKSVSLLNAYFAENKMPYIIVSKTSSEKVDGKKKSIRYWEVIGDVVPRKMD